MKKILCVALLSACTYLHSQFIRNITNDTNTPFVLHNNGNIRGIHAHSTIAINLDIPHCNLDEGIAQEQLQRHPFIKFTRYNNHAQMGLCYNLIRAEFILMGPGNAIDIIAPYEILPGDNPFDFRIVPRNGNFTLESEASQNIPQ